MLIIHILFSAIMFGNMVTFLILSITIATTEDSSLIVSCYKVMHILSNSSIKASTIGTTITGILLCIWTNWGLFKYNWIIVKEILTLLLIGLNVWGMYAWTLDALNGVGAERLWGANLSLWTGIILQIVSLIFIFAISIFKPWGKRKIQKAPVK
nr:hypothetical protein [Bacillus sp. FJAT-50079]